MNNKHFFVIIAFISLMAALMEPRGYESLMYVLRILMCGGAFYYVGLHFREKRKVSLLLLLMLAVGVLVQPIVPIHLSLGLRLMIDLLSAFIFYWAALKFAPNKPTTPQ